MASPQGAGRFCWTLSRASSQYFFNRTADSLLRTSDQRHFGLLTNCGLGHLLRTAKLTAASCGLRTLRISLLVSQFAVSQQSAMPLVCSPQCHTVLPTPLTIPSTLFSGSKYFRATSRI